MDESNQTKDDQRTGPDDMVGQVQVVQGAPLMSRRVMWAKTCSMMVLYVILGLFSGITGPSIIDLTELLNCNYEQISAANGFKALGNLIAALIGSFVADRFRKKADIYLAVSLFIGGLIHVAIPWAPNLYLYGFMQVFMGVCQQGTNVACCAICLAIWGEKGSTPIHMLQMMFPVGLTLATPLTKPFLSTHNSTLTPGDMAIPYDNLTTEVPPLNTTDTRIFIPYGIIGGLSVMTSFMFLAFFLAGSTYESQTISESRSLRDMLNPGRCSGGNKGLGSFFGISLVAFFMLTSGRDRGFYSLLVPMAVHTEGINLPKPTAVTMYMCFVVSTVIGRVTAMLISIFLKVQFILFGEIILGLVLAILLVCLGLTNTFNLWILTCFFAMVTTPNHPSMMAFTDRYIELNGSVVAVIDIGIGLGCLYSSWLCGHLFQHYGSSAVLYLSLGGAIGVTAVLVPLQIVGCYMGDRHERLKQQEMNAVIDENTPLIN